MLKAWQGDGWRQPLLDWRRVEYPFVAYGDKGQRAAAEGERFSLVLARAWTAATETKAPSTTAWRSGHRRCYYRSG